ncbi:MAG TPA: type II toxin-antitoxin system PemK/MazF family toxin [Campylobacterales bacterium]|nr:type II toxin-antitoxin system PemK/MazF family toxin [Campylobacterales bacterium]
MKSNKPKRGDVWLVDFDEVRKDEVGKIRPALIVQNDEINKHYNSTIVIPFSTQTVLDSEPLRVNYSLSFLDKNSDLIIPQIKVISNTRLIKYLGIFPPSELPKVSRYLTIALALA